ALEYLTVTACRRNLAGDVCAIMCVHAFLEQWDLINYQIDPDQRPAALAPPFTGHFCVILDTPRGLQSLHPGARPKDPNAQAAVNGATKPSPTPASLELRNSIYQTSAKSSSPVSSTEAASLANSANGISGDNPTTIKYQCDTCGVNCTSARCHSLKQKNFELCPPCYLDGCFPSHMYSGDFVKLTSTTSANGSAIEEHVGTRSVQHCIRKFLHLPIEDPYVSAEGDFGPLRYAHVPLEQADNPVMSVMVFLAGVISPGVAAEAAKTALHQLTDGDTKVAPEEDQKEEAATAQDDMQVDAESQVQWRAVKVIPHSKVVRTADLALRSASKAAGALADAEDLQIRSTLASLIKLTLTKLELKTA
ncbi:uncharacterized protein TRAVEDRAFT_28313, partial [Trametes versicolor FP-101664 SS1]|uniref:uncharacterized protein n=1 Tax=Trametes versicolor (strain FP-101664) TaxID=717944 RepID=UPI00046232EA